MTSKPIQIRPLRLSPEHTREVMAERDAALGRETRSRRKSRSAAGDDAAIIASISADRKKNRPAPKREMWAAKLSKI